MIDSLEEKQRHLTDQRDSAQATVLELQRSLEHYRAVVEHANEGMIVLKDKRVVYANARAAEISAIPLEEMREIGFFHRIHPDDQAMALDRQRRRLAGKDVASRYELRLLLPMGVIRWISVSVTVAPWDEGQAALVFFSDISHRRGLEEKLRDTLEERETILENSLVGIALLTSKGVIRWSNREMTRLFGVSGGSTYTDWRRLFPSQEEYLRIATEVDDCIRKGRVYRSDLQMCRLDGKPLWVTVTGKAVSAVDKTQGSVWAAVDITPRKELEVALARASSEREAVFNSALVGISFNVDRRIQWVNDKYEEMTGYPRAELVGGSTRKFFVDDQTFESESRDTWAILSRDGVYVDERRLLRRDGKILCAGALSLVR